MRVAIGGPVLTAEDVDFVVEADRLGAHSVWVPEAWGQDALTPLGYLAARTSRIGLGSGIVQVGARTPANLAMSALSLQALSGGRFLLGVGTSGPQVMEGWHGVRFPSPLSATRETVEIVRRVAAGEKLEHRGKVFELPLPGGPGRPIRSMLPPAPVPVYIAALGPKNLALTGEIADGWIGNAFLPEHADAFLAFLEEGVARAGGGADPRRPRPADPRRRRVHRRRRRGRRPSRPGLRLHDRRHGQQRPQLLQRRLRPAGLRRRRRRRAGSLARRAAGTRPPSGSPSRSA